MSPGAIGIVLFLCLFFPIAAAVKCININRKRAEGFFLGLSLEQGYRLSFNNAESRYELSGEFRNHLFEIHYEKFYDETTSKGIPSLFIRIETPDLQTEVMAIESTRFFLNNREMDIRFNDSGFDDALLITGSSTAGIRAALSPEARKHIKDFLVHPDFLRLDIVRKISPSGAFRVNLQYRKNLESHELMRWLGKIMDFIDLIARKGTAEDMLRQNYLAEKFVGPKIKYLESLSIVCTKLKLKDDIISDAMASKHPELMFTAVKAVGEEAYRLIPDIFTSADDILKTRIIRYAGQKRIKSLIPFFSKELQNFGSISSRMEILSFFSAAGADSAAEEQMHRFLSAVYEDDIDTYKEFYYTFVRILGKCGTCKSIAFLNSIRKKFPERLINQAIACIQERIGVGDAGWLSIDQADGGEGELSLEDKD